MFIQKKWKKVGQMLPNAFSPSNNKTEFIFVSIIANRDEKKPPKECVSCYSIVISLLMVKKRIKCRE